MCDIVLYKYGNLTRWPSKEVVLVCGHVLRDWILVIKTSSSCGHPSIIVFTNCIVLHDVVFLFQGSSDQTEFEFCIHNGKGIVSMFLASKK